MEKEWKAYEIGELDQYLFGQGNHYEIYKKLGAHMVDDEGLFFEKIVKKFLFSPQFSFLCLRVYETQL